MLWACHVFRLGTDFVKGALVNDKGKRFLAMLQRIVIRCSQILNSRPGIASNLLFLFRKFKDFAPATGAVLKFSQDNVLQVSGYPSM